MNNIPGNAFGQSIAPKTTPFQDDPIWVLGSKSGYEKCRVEILGFLEEKYMGKGRPDRHSPKAEAILTLAREISAHLKKN